jgi:hypothetical protein
MSLPLPTKFVPPIRTLPGVQYGIIVTLFSGVDTSYNYELQRATSSAGAGATTIANNIPNSQKVFVDTFGNNGTTYWYRIRHVMGDELPSAWTPWIPGVPSLISLAPVPAKPVRATIAVAPVGTGALGTVTLTITDPQGRVSLVEFETIVAGVSSGWVTSGGPYIANVAIDDAVANAINYRVTGFDDQGVGRVLWQDGFAFTRSAVLNATRDLVLLAGGGVVVAGNSAMKSTGTNDTWDGQAYSTAGYGTGAYAQAESTLNQGPTMFGLNTDPATDASYTSIDYAIYIRGDNTIDVYESGTGVSIGTAYVTGDVFAVSYDGSYVRYLKNGTIFRTVTVGGGLKFFFDSSFYAPVGDPTYNPSRLSNIRFGPMTSNRADSIGAATFITGINESTGKAVNRQLAKPLSSDPDTLASTADGGGRYAAVQANADQTSANIAKGVTAFACSLRDTTTPTIATSTVTAMSWNTSDSDTHAMQSGTSIVCDSTGGLVIITATIRWPSSNTLGTRQLRLYKNSSQYLETLTATRSTYNAGEFWQTYTWYDYAPVSGDSYQIAGWQDSGSTIAQEGKRFLVVHLRG